MKYWRCQTCGCVGRLLHEYYGGCAGFMLRFRPQFELFPEIAFPPVFVGRP